MNELFNGFFEKAINHKTEQNLQNPNFDNLNEFKSKISNITSMNDHDIVIAIKNGIDEISDDILSGLINTDEEINKAYNNLFINNRRFIFAFIKAISSIPISCKVRLACNTLTYDYLTSGYSDPELKKNFLYISRIVNSQEISKLVSIGLDESTASNLALCRYSSTKESVNIRRLNFTLYNKDPNVMNEQMIVWIYEKLFDRVSNLFYEIMLETYTPQQEEDFGEGFMEIYGSVGLAILDILNNMTSDNIKQILNGYYEAWEYCNRSNVRFSLRSLSGDYSRITSVVEYLSKTGKDIP